METSEKLFKAGHVYSDILWMAHEAKELQKWRLQYEYQIVGLKKESAVAFEKCLSLRTE